MDLPKKGMVENEIDEGIRVNNSTVCFFSDFCICFVLKQTKCGRGRYKENKLFFRSCVILNTPVS